MFLKAIASARLNRISNRQVAVVVVVVVVVIIVVVVVLFSFLI